MTSPTQSNINQTQINDFWAYHFKQNPGPITEYFKQLLDEYPEDMGKGKTVTDNTVRRGILTSLVRCRGWRENKIAKLLELANDEKAANDARIKFYDKYVGELFLEGVGRSERVENELLETRIIPFLKGYLEELGNKKIDM